MVDDGLSVGTEAVEVLFPRLYIDLKELEEARGYPKGSITSRDVGIGNLRSAVGDAYQNPVTLGATLVHRTMKKYKLKPDDVAGLMVGTESSPDEAVAINCRIIGALEQIYGEGSLRYWGFPEAKAACAGEGFNNYFAHALFWSGEIDEDLKIFSLAVDHAGYRTKSREESTRGEGAALEIIGTNPIWNLHRRETSRVITDEYGFSRPFGERFPQVRPKESIISYNYLQRDNVDGLTKRVVKKGIIDPYANQTILNYVNRLIVHIPYWRMPRDYAVFLYRHVVRNIPEIWNPILKKIDMEKEPAHDGKGSIESIMKDKDLWVADKEFRRKITETEEFKKFFDYYFLPALHISPEVGNCYNASLPLGKRSILEIAYRDSIDITGEVHAFGYFGSGAVGIARIATVQPKWKEVAKDYKILEWLKPEEEGGQRVKIDVDTYEFLDVLTSNFHNKRAWILEPENEFIISGADADGHLKYQFIG